MGNTIDPPTLLVSPGASRGKVVAIMQGTPHRTDLGRQAQVAHRSVQVGRVAVLASTLQQRGMAMPLP